MIGIMIETNIAEETTTTPTISMPPGTVVGYRANGKPIYNIAGGSIEVTDDSEDDDDVSASVEDDDDDEDAEPAWTPPTQEEFERLIAAKSKADSEAASRKRFLREAGLDPKTGKPVAKKVELDLGDDDDESDDPTPKLQDKSKGPSKAELQRQVEREIAKAEQRERAKGTRLIAAVPEALDDAGWNGRNLPRMLKLLDLDSIEVDSDGEVDGLKEQIDELKKDFPEFFKRQRMKDAAKEVADTAAVGGGKKKVAPQAEAKDWASTIAEALSRGQ